MQEQFTAAIQEAVTNAPERKFVESLEFAFTIKDVDLKNPNNRIKEEIRLPSGRGRDIRVAMFASGEAAEKAKAGGIDVFPPEQIEEMGTNKGMGKKVANRYDFFLSEVPHMGLVGRWLGVILGPRGKMPRPVPPVVDPAAIAAGLRTTVVVKSGDKMTFHATNGTASQSIDELVANAMEVYNRVLTRLERGPNNIRSLYVKTTMGPSVKVEVLA
jgi:large subunit ribosomal protein L1